MEQAGSPECKNENIKIKKPHDLGVESFRESSVYVPKLPVESLWQTSLDLFAHLQQNRHLCVLKATFMWMHT